MDRFGDVQIRHDGHVAVLEIQRPPYNYFDSDLIAAIADALETLDGDDRCRAVVLASQGRAFCAGADFQADTGRNLFGDGPAQGAGELYRHALRLFRTRKPIVAAVHGPAVGGGLGLALVADFRVVCPDTRFAANFVQLGVHAGFGISVVLPRIVGQQNAALLLLTGRRIGPDQAMAMGLADVMAERDSVRAAAVSLAAEIACCAPLAVESHRATLRRGLAESVEEQLVHEFAEQQRLARTRDHAEGIRAVRERRPGRFTRS